MTGFTLLEFQSSPDAWMACQYSTIGFISTDELRPFQPQMQYFLLDENRCTPDELALKNLVSCLVKIEQNQDLDTYKDLFDELEALLAQKTHTPSLARIFLEWLSRTLLSSKLGLEPQHLPVIENFAKGKIILRYIECPYSSRAHWATR